MVRDYRSNYPRWGIVSVFLSCCLPNKLSVLKGLARIWPIFALLTSKVENGIVSPLKNGHPSYPAGRQTHRTAAIPDDSISEK